MTELEKVLESMIEKSVTEKVEKMFSERAKENIQPPAEDLMNVDEVAKFINLSKQSIYILSMKNEIPSIKKGKKLYFSRSDIRTWIMQGKRKTNFELNADAKNFKTKKG